MSCWWTSETHSKTPHGENAEPWQRGRSRLLDLGPPPPCGAPAGPPTPREGGARERGSRRTLWPCSARPAWASRFLPTQSQARWAPPAFLVNRSRSPLARSVTSLYLRRFVVQMFLARLSVFGRCSVSSHPETSLLPQLHQALAGTSKPGSSEKFCPNPHVNLIK